LSGFKRSLAIGAISVSLIAVTIGYLSYVRPVGEEPPISSVAQISNDPNLNGTYSPSQDSATETSTPTIAPDLPAEGQPILRATELAKKSRTAKPLNPYVALALTTTQLTTEEICPALAKEAKGNKEPANGQVATPAPTERPERDEKGCVLPIGSEPSAATAQASMPIERPPTFLGRQKLNFMPYLGGLGAAVAAVPVINGLSTNKHNRQPVSPQ
jgi:hypothetical protein